MLAFNFKLLLIFVSVSVSRISINTRTQWLLRSDSYTFEATSCHNLSLKHGFCRYEVQKKYLRHQQINMYGIKKIFKGSEKILRWCGVLPLLCHFQILWFLNLKDSSPLFWSPCPLVPMVPWCSGPLAFGPLVLWSLVLWSLAPLGLLVPWSFRPLVTLVPESNLKISLNSTDRKKEFKQPK